MDDILQNTSCANPAAALSWMLDHGVDVPLEDTLVQVKSPVRATTPAINDIPSPDRAPVLSETRAPSATQTHPPALAVPTADLTDALAAAHLAAQAAATPADLHAAIQAFDGLALKRHASQIVFADGDPAARIMVIGDMPSDEDDATGKPFMGEPGEMLTKMFGAIGLDRSSARGIYITHMINWRPPGNRSPTEAEIALSLVFARRHIDLIRPQILVLVGATATKAILATDQGIMRCHGKWHDYAMNDGGIIKAMPIYHPAFLMKTPTKKRDAWDDLLAIKAALDGVTPEA